MGCISVLFPAVELSLTGAYRLRRCAPRRNEAQARREWIAAPAARRREETHGTGDDPESGLPAAWIRRRLDPASADPRHGHPVHSNGHLLPQ